MTATAATGAPVTGTGARMRRMLGALLAIEVFSGFQQSYFAPLFSIVTDRYHIGVAALAWTVTGPALVSVVATPVLTALGDRHGHARVLRPTVAVVAVGAALIAFAPDYPVLLAGRLFQGALAGFLPLMIGLVRGRQDGEGTRRAIAYLSGALLFGVLLGNACASKLHAAALWMAVVGTVAGLAALWWTRDEDAERRSAAATAGDGDGGEVGAGVGIGGGIAIDWRGAALLAGGLVPILLALHQGAGWGWLSAPVVGCVLGGVALLAAWVAVERRTAAPLIDVRRYFRPRLLPVFAVGACVNFVVIGGQISYTTYFTAHSGLALPASAVGLILLPAFCAMALFSALTTRISALIGYRRTMITGAGLLLAGASGILAWHRTGGEFAGLLGLAGAGMGLTAGAGRILAVDAVRIEETAASEGVFEVVITLGSAAGSAVYAAILAAGGDHGYRTAWAVGAGAALLSLAAASALPRRHAGEG